MKRIALKKKASSAAHILMSCRCCHETEAYLPFLPLPGESIMAWADRISWTCEACRASPEAL